MIVNGAHIQGIFKYNTGLSFERGDFVIYDGVIYTCTAENPTDSFLQVVENQIPPQHPENFKVYLGDKVASVEEYLKYVESPEDSEDKYISSYTLSGILNHYIFGLGERGIIKEYVQYNNSSGITLTQGLKDLLRNGVTPDGVLGEILRSENLNNAVVMISSDLPEVKALDGGSQTGFILLRQSTYTDGGKVRVQELINPTRGKVWWRATEPGNWNSVTTWKSSFYSDQVKTELDYLYNYYQQKITELEVLKSGLEKTWRYESILFSRATSITLQNNNPGEEGYLPVGSGNFKPGDESEVFSLPDSMILQICYRKRVALGSNTWTSGVLMLDLRDSLINTAANITQYQVGTVVFTVERLSDDRVNINFRSEDGNDCVVYNVFYRKYYE